MKVYVCDYCETKLGEIALSNSIGGSYCSVECANKAEGRAAVEVTANDIRWQPERVIDLLANLARRVSSLESKLGSVEAQLADTQGNVERQAEEIAELKHLAESNEEDIRELDERTQVVNAIQKYYGGAR